jgi:hypothetical protein
MDSGRSSGQIAGSHDVGKLPTDRLHHNFSGAGTGLAAIATMNAKHLLLLPLLALAPMACAEEDAVNDEDDLTSLTARSRELSFEGVVYVAEGASDATILAAAQQQTKTAFGAFREANIAVNSRELREISPATFKKRKVTVVDPAIAADPGKPMLEVRYGYKDNAVVSPEYASRSSINSAVLGARQLTESNRVFTECSANDSHTRGYPLWYGFNPSLESCVEAMKVEDDAIRADRARLGAGATDRIPASQANRLYFPITVKLGADKTAKKKTFPEYDRLYAGGVERDKLVIGLVYGMIDHGAPAGGPQNDAGYGEWVDNINELNKVRKFEFVSIDTPEGITSAKLASGKMVSGLTFEGILGWKNGGSAGMEGLTSAERTELKKIMGQRLFKHWITLESKAKVKIGSAAEKDFTYKIITYFGIESAEGPHKVGLKNSDVYVYNGHSYIGAGPLDPGRYTAADFPKSYQILFIDGCVSYNYYHKGYIPLKEGGTKNLDLITNGLESPSWRSGYASGQLLGTLINGKGASYQELLEVASDTDALRVVDGELDNRWSATRAPVTVR